VAEREHVQQAARDLRIAGSSLSRSVRLVEQALGLKLFFRVGRNLKLTAEGQELLAAVRDGMRRIDDGVATLTGTNFKGALNVACEGEQPLSLVCRAAERLAERHPELLVTVRALPSAGAQQGLLAGALDLVITRDPRLENRLVASELAVVTYGIYCGPSHPLSRVRRVSTAELLRHPFVTPSATDDADNWPAALPRIVGLALPSLAAAISVCAKGRLLAVLPDHAAPSELRRLPSEVVPPVRLRLLRRAPLGPVDRTTPLVEALLEEAKRGP